MNRTSFKPGVSGNPRGRPKQTAEQRDALEHIRALAPEAVDWMESYLRNPTGNPTVKKGLCEIILDRTYGKTVTSVTVTSGDFSALDKAFEEMGRVE